MPALQGAPSDGPPAHGTPANGTPANGTLTDGALTVDAAEASLGALPSRAVGTLPSRAVGVLPQAPVDDPLGRSVCAFVNTIAHAGVRHVCACPGSRSTPLLLALHAHPGIKLWMHLDERSAAYFALGLAKTLCEPVGLLATSGTAAANFFPAVVEAWYARVPLVVLTADRPHELRDCGAPQTIDQLHLYGRHARWFVDLPEPDGSAQLIQHVRLTAARAVATAVEDPAGPVQVNWPLREPLVPRAFDFPEPSRDIKVRSGKRVLPEALLDQLAAELRAIERGLIVCGPESDPALAPAVSGLAGATGFPILADPLSGVRFGAHERALVLDAYDAFLRLPSLLERFPAPELVLRLGALPTSKPVLQYLQRYPDIQHVVVDAAGWRDPTGLAGQSIHADPALTCAALAAHLAPRPPSDWTHHWLCVQRATREAIATTFDELDGELSEPRAFAELARLLPPRARLYVGNSMPVRDLDTFVGASGAEWRVLANRGANGIDGVVSSALGASAAGQPPTVLVIGDVSFYHDLNGLLAARQHALDLLVVLLNNDGGGIFSFLPQAGVDGFEQLFGTPHGLDFRPFVEGYGGSFARVRDWVGFREAITHALGRGGLRVVEISTGRERNVRLHRAIWRRVDRTVQDALAAAAA